MLKLRDYQEEATQAVFDFFERDQRGGNPLVVAPTGSGKALLIAEFMRRACADYPETRIMNVIHTQELVEQNWKECRGIWPGVPAGIYSAGLNKRQTRSQITFASIQSIYKKASAFGHVDLLLIDEAHMVPRDSTTMYGRFIEDLQQINPNMRVIGWTATPFRMDSGYLHRGDDAIFDEIVYEIPIKMLIDRGYLAEPIAVSTDLKLSTAGVKKRSGEFITRELDKAVNTDDNNVNAVSEIIVRGADRKHWLIFCITVEHAENVKALLNRCGITAELVTGKTPKARRKQLIENFKAGRFRALVNVGVLTTGFNAPATDLLAVLRPTASPGLWVQIIGRGMRTAPGKDDCLVLDFGRNAHRHGPLDALSIEDKRESDGEGLPPAKECPKCETFVHASFKICPECDFEFPIEAEDKKIEAKPSEAVILTPPKKWQSVLDFFVKLHKKRGDPAANPTLKVTYLLKMGEVSEYIPLEHTGYPRKKAERWWRQYTNGAPIPATVSEAVSRVSEIRVPKQIIVEYEQGFPRVYRVNFSEGSLDAG